MEAVCCSQRVWYVCTARFCAAILARPDTRHTLCPQIKEIYDEKLRVRPRWGEGGSRGGGGGILCTHVTAGGAGDRTCVGR